MQIPFLRLAVAGIGVIVIAIASGTAAQATEALPGTSSPATCAGYDLQFFAELGEDASGVGTSHDRLSAAAMACEARMLCVSGRVAESIALYRAAQRSLADASSRAAGR